MVSIGIGLDEKSFDDVKDKVLNNANQIWIDVKFVEAKVLPPLIRDKSSLVRYMLDFFYLLYLHYIYINSNINDNLDLILFIKFKI